MAHTTVGSGVVAQPGATENQPGATESQPGRIVVLASGGGTNCQALIDACDDGDLDARVVAVV